MNTTDYIIEGLRQLGDPLFYKELDHDPTQQFANEIDLVLKDMLGLNLITNKNYDFLSLKNCTRGRFYTACNTQVLRVTAEGRQIGTSVIMQIKGCTWLVFYWSVCKEAAAKVHSYYIRQCYLSFVSFYN
jgi:hypothetical protein